MLNYLKNECNTTYTENGAYTYKSTMSECLDLFATIGAVRFAADDDIIARFMKAYAEQPDIAMKILFFGRDIRGGLGERRVFRVIIRWLADNRPESLLKNLSLIAEYGRYDDLLCLLGTSVEKNVLELIKHQLLADLSQTGEISLLAKWLPSVNASNADTVKCARKIARYLGMSEAEYRKTLVALRKKIKIIENSLRTKDYTFDYSKQPSKAMLKYREAFYRNDKDRYIEFLNSVMRGEERMHTDTLMPYDIVSLCVNNKGLSAEQRKMLDVSWKSLEDFTADENAIAVVDGSGSMYGGRIPPISVALSLGIYFAEKNKGAFHNHFITFSRNPQMVEVKGSDLYEKVQYCMQYNEIANTDLEKVFELILVTAIKNKVSQDELPTKIYIISDMEFDYCVKNNDETNFKIAKKLFAEYGYKLPDVVFWNVNSRNIQQPVKKNEQGVALVSGCSPRLFSMVTSGIATPYNMMMDILSSERYEPISA